MDSWTQPVIPALPGNGRQLRLYDSATQRIRTVGPRAGTARMYVCGITPYDAAHLGHIATYVTFDIVGRVWRDAGLTVEYVQNVTDVDDPLLERAARDDIDWHDLAVRETDRFRRDMAALCVAPPDRYVGVVESVDAIGAAVAQLVAAGAAYELIDGTGDIYFDIKSASEFGYVSHLDRDQMVPSFAEHGGDPDRVGKRSALDPLLWRGERAGEPSWGSPVGPGRPGWHIECSVIAVDALGIGFDLQGGGADLLFPHHEMSAAHAEVARPGHRFAGTYAHAGLIGLHGEKMSKSKGNLVFASTLLDDGVPAGAIRLALLTDHYRTEREWTDELLQSARTRFAHWRQAAARSGAAEAGPLLAALRERLADDLDTPGALAAVDEWAAASLVGDLDAEAPTLAADAVQALLGVDIRS